MGGFVPSIIIITRSTRLQGLRRRWGTLGQARFVLESAQAGFSEAMGGGKPQPTRRSSGYRTSSSQESSQGYEDRKNFSAKEAEFDEYQEEDTKYQQVVDKLETELHLGYPVTKIDRSYVANFDFGLAGLIVVIGQDGLVANVAKYCTGIPIVAVNPDPTRIDGILLPFTVDGAAQVAREVLRHKRSTREVTLAQVDLNDGQKMLAFNDFFIGNKSHVSARYVITDQGQQESHSSSGILVSTPAGSTGWMSSMFNMTAAIAAAMGTGIPVVTPKAWDLQELQWIVREPFLSRVSQAGLVIGSITPDRRLVIESLMPESGVIFSDGIEDDFLAFNTGSIATVSISDQKALLVI